MEPNLTNQMLLEPRLERPILAPATELEPRSRSKLDWSPSRPALLRYGVAVLSAALALGCARLLEIHLVSEPAALFMLAVMFSAWYGGARPGLVAAALSLLALVYCFVPPIYSFAVEIQEVPRVIIVALAILLVVGLTSAQRNASEALRTARDDLRRTVGELRQINEVLRSENSHRRGAELALEDLPGRLIGAQEQERRRIGRELHDHIVQTLCLLAIKIDQLRASPELLPSSSQMLAELRQNTSDLIDDVHGISHRLHPAALDHLGLVPALQSLVSELSERHGIAITFVQRSLPASLPSGVALCLFRVAEEALTNIVKHSQAQSASLQATGAPDGLHLRIEDAGTGFDMTTLASKAGLGFVSMQERLRVLHGTMRVDSAPSRGTRIIAWIPPGG